MASQERNLQDLTSVGPAIAKAFEMLGIRSVAQLSRRNPEKLYERLCEITGQTQDICCLDVFRAAVAQARNARLHAEPRPWWHWSRRRKSQDVHRSKAGTHN